MITDNYNYALSDILENYYDTADQLRQYQLDLALEFDRKTNPKKSTLKTKEAFEEKRERTRRAFINAIGGLDFEKTPLKPRFTGEIKREGFTLKKLYFESLPSIFVTANLYVPSEIGGKIPAVLMACGHSKNGKAYPSYQRAAMDLAREGIATLLVDPVSQGERQQYTKLELKSKGDFISPTQEHTYLDEPLTFAGANIARYMIWDLIRAIDLLESLDFVDRERIGMLGQSGGGTQTAYMLLVEDRIAAAMPCCYVTKRYEHMKSANLHDAEQNIFNVIPNGIDYDDIVSGIAPRPVRLGVAKYDFFCVEGALKTFDNLKHLYSLYEKEDNVSVSVVDAPHSLNSEMRQSVVNFFRKNFLFLDESFVTSDGEVFTEDEVRVTETGSVLDLPGARHIFELTREYFNKVRYNNPSNKEELVSRVLEVTNLKDKLTERKKIEFPRVVADEIVCGIRVRKILFFSENNVMCSGVLLENEDSMPEKCTVYISENSTKSIYENRDDIENLLARGAVFVLDVRGTGSVKSRQIGEDFSLSYGPLFTNEYRHNNNLLMLGSSLYAVRSFDAVRACDLMSDYFKFKSVTLAGRGLGATYALTAAALLGAKPTVFGTAVCYEERFSSVLHECDPSQAVHGMLKKYDIPLLIKMLEAERL